MKKEESEKCVTVQKDKTLTEDTVVHVQLEGIRDAMFDRYPGDNQTKLQWWQKLYFGKDGETIIYPSVNFMSFLTAHNSNSAPKRFLDAKSYKKAANACLSFVTINPIEIPFERNGEVIKFGGIKPNEDRDERSGVYLHQSVARLDKGIPNPKSRPVLPMPWTLRFDLQVMRNKEIQLQQIEMFFVEGGIAIGIGTFRGVFGKFKVVRFEIDRGE